MLLNFAAPSATLAQLVEQQTENLRVWSSILRGGKLEKMIKEMAKTAVYLLFLAFFYDTIPP